MRITEGYVLRNIRGTHYILPIGQNIALHKRGIQLNDTGVFLWNALKQGTIKEDLLPLLVRHYKTDASDIPALQSDIDTFIEQLSSLNLLSEEAEPSACDHYFKIGDITIGYHGPNTLLYPSLLDFSCNADSADQHWTIETPPPFPLQTGEVLIRTPEIEICQSSNYYMISYFHDAQLIKTRISLDGTRACFYCIPPWNDILAEKLFHAFRFAFLIYAQRKGFFVIHSSSILYKDKAWLFSASSGTGKSTHAGLWHALYQTPVLNGDLNLISIQNSQPILWGIPWCGTSRIFTTKSYPLGGITLLKQHSENKLQALSKSEQLLMVMQRFISPTWTEEMMDFNLNFSDKLVDCISIFRLLCTKEPCAAQMMKQLIDKTLNK